MKNFLLYIFPATLVMVVLVNLFIPEPQFQNWEEKADYYELLGDVGSQVNAFEQLVNEDSVNVDYHFNYLVAHFSLPKKTFSTTQGDLVRDDNRVLSKYRALLYSDDPEVREIGKLGLGLCFHFLKLYDESVYYLNELRLHEIKYINYLYGGFYFHYDYEKSEYHYLREINLFPSNGLAYERLAELYYENERPEKIVALLENPNANEFLSIKQKRYAYFMTEDILSYSQTIFLRFFDGLNIYGFIGAFFILVLWFFYLTRIHKQLVKYRLSIFLTLILGMIFAFGTSVLTDFNKYILDFHRTGNVLYDFYYCVVGIGMIEELVKIIPVLIIGVLLKRFKEPIDFIVFASISALGFAFIENLIYFDQSGLKTIQGRALSATVTHMFDSSMVAYGIVIGKFSRKRNWVLYLLATFLIGSILHGFYDFWLINEWASKLNFITFLWLLISMILWVSIINNCINNSYSEKVAWSYQPKKLNNILLFGLSMVFVLEYILVGINFGPDIANEELQKDFASGLFLLIFLTISLSKFDYIPNYWAPLRIWDWDVFLSIPRIEPKYFDLKRILGKRVQITPSSPNSVLKSIAPIQGEVVSRELINWEKDWYLVKLDVPIQVGFRAIQFLIVKVKNPNEILLENSEQIVLVRIVNHLDNLSEKRKKKRDFLFVDLAKIERLD